MVKPYNYEVLGILALPNPRGDLGDATLIVVVISTALGAAPALQL
jgi:hypothetical protein